MPAEESFMPGNGLFIRAIKRFMPTVVVLRVAFDACKRPLLAPPPMPARTDAALE